MKKVMLVEDNEYLVRAMLRNLKRVQIEITAVGSVEEALDHFKAGNIPDVVVTDHYLPGMCGAELLVILASDYPKIWRVLYSSAPPASIGIRAALADVILAKPSLTDDFLAAIELKR